jgi:hypothetical protein
MRTTEKIVAILILSLVTWAILMMVFTNFQGSVPNRILLVELGSDAASLNEAVQANGRLDREGIAHNIQVVVRNTEMDFFFIVLYWLTILGLAYLAGLLGKPFFAACAAICISVAAVADVLENTSILAAMRVSTITDALAVDISEYSQWKWAFFFLALFFLGLATALNRHVSSLRRASGGVFIAAGVLGLLGISRYRVSLDFAILMIRLGVLFFIVGLCLTLWKIYQSVKELNHLPHADRHEYMPSR